MPSSRDVVIVVLASLGWFLLNALAGAAHGTYLALRGLREYRAHQRALDDLGWEILDENSGGKS